MMNIKQTTASGLGRLIDNNKSFAQVQGAWRFYKNERVKIEDLNRPILEIGKDEIEKNCDKYVLMMTDWSHINYLKHKTKKELIKKSNGNGKKQKGYELQTTIAVSDKTGEPLFPVVQNLKTSENVLSTYNHDLDISLDHFEEFEKRAEWIKENIQTEHKKVHIIDREGDVAGLYRHLDKQNEKFLIRGKTVVNIYNPKDKENWKQGELAKSLDKGKKFKRIKYYGKNVDIYVNDIDVEMRRDTTKKKTNKNGKDSSTRTKGNAIKVKLVVSKLIDSNNNIVATWILITNISDVPSTTIAQWYYYRWKIESFFKLLKSSGFFMESWQEQNPLGIFKKLLVTSFCSILVWKINNNCQKETIKFKEFLVRLSGRGLECKKKSTLPSILAGLWIFLQMMDTLKYYEKEKLLDMQSTLNSVSGFEF